VDHLPLKTIPSCDFYQADNFLSKQICFKIDKNLGHLSAKQFLTFCLKLHTSPVTTLLIKKEKEKKIINLMQ